MTLDKGYYDYDFEPSPTDVVKELADSVRSEEDTNKLVSKFGFGINNQKKPSEMNIEELQEYAMSENN